MGAVVVYFPLLPPGAILAPTQSNILGMSYKSGRDEDLYFFATIQLDKNMAPPNLTDSEFPSWVTSAQVIEREVKVNKKDSKRCFDPSIWIKWNSIYETNLTIGNRYCWWAVLKIDLCVLINCSWENSNTLVLEKPKVWPVLLPHFRL